MPRPLLLASALLALPLASQAVPPPGDPVTKVDAFKDTYRHGEVFVSGQPTLEALRAFREQGVKLVVNVRDEKEMKDFTAASFNEEAVVKELGMAYLWLPLGDKAAYTPAVLEKLEAALKAHPGRVLIHCAVGGRATLVHMARLVKYGGRSLDEAAAVGRRMRFSFYLEDLLGTPVSFRPAERRPS